VTVLFWLSVSLIIYSYFIYPVLLISCSAIKQTIYDAQHLVTKQPLPEDNIDLLPSVSIIIAAYNEGSCIEGRVNNLLALNYPAEKLTLHIGSDGSSDNTADILNGFSAKNYHPHIFEVNRGKMSVLNDLIAQSEDDILIMSDANTHFNADVVYKLVRHFNDDKIGAVCGELHLVDAQSGDNKDSVYWRYEQVLKFHESRLGALLGANGAIYAMRKALFKPLPANTIVDDFQIVMNISKEKHHTIYDPEAIAIEEVAPDLNAEEGRRIRIGLGNYQAFFNMAWALNPLLGWRFLAYLSHKVCRWFVPHLMIIAFISNCLLLDQAIYQLSFMAQISFYLIAYYGIKRQRSDKKVNPFVGLIAFFVSMNIALFKGFIRYFNSNVQGTWKRTSR
jgi:cellulose synthase/poly-beta-1,6-N-acetylglucosamine synthase-like glycosyltransferase